MFMLTVASSSLNLGLATYWGTSEDLLSKSEIVESIEVRNLLVIGEGNSE
jgi:hypothetical protein